MLEQVYRVWMTEYAWRNDACSTARRWAALRRHEASREGEKKERESAIGTNRREGDGRLDTGTTKRIAEAGTYEVRQARFWVSNKIRCHKKKKRAKTASGKRPASRWFFAIEERRVQRFVSRSLRVRSPAFIVSSVYAWRPTRARVTPARSLRKISYWTRVSSAKLIDHDSYIAITIDI